MAQPTPGISTWPDPTELTFHPFLRLPIELRRMILDACLQVPRVITVERRTQVLKVNKAHVQKISSAYVNQVDRQVPALLHVCKEIREYALKFYRPAFHGRLQSKTPMYFNFAVDYIHYFNIFAAHAFDFPDNNLHLGSFERKHTYQFLERVIIGAPRLDGMDYSIGGNYLRGVKGLLRKYEGLDTLIFEAPENRRRMPGKQYLPRLTKIMKSSKRLPSESIPHTIHLVSHEILSGMIEETVDAAQICACSRVVRPITNNTKDNRRVSYCWEEDSKQNDDTNDEAEEFEEEDGEEADNDDEVSQEGEEEEELEEHDSDGRGCWHLCIHQQAEEDRGMMEGIEKEAQLEQGEDFKPEEGPEPE